MKCAYCGQAPPLERAIQAVGRGWKAFCSTEHQYEFTKNQNKKKRHEAKDLTPRACRRAGCKNVFKLTFGNAHSKKFCSVACYEAHWKFLNGRSLCEMCEEPISDVRRRLHPGSKVCSDNCDRERRALTSRIAAEKRKGP